MPVLDAWAVLAFLRDEAAAQQVEEAVLAERTYISSVNLGEVLYWTIRERGERAAEVLIDLVRAIVMVEDPDWALVRAAARIKADGGLSFADAFCVATAQRHGMPVYTGDPEILALGDLVESVDLRA
jgi:PIN domain nuclease of toxin-antitoxin system